MCETSVVLPISESSGRSPFSPFANVASAVSSVFGFSVCWLGFLLLCPPSLGVDRFAHFLDSAINGCQLKRVLFESRALDCCVGSSC